MADERTTVVKTGGSNVGLVILAIAVVLAAVLAFVFFQNQRSHDPVSSAASAVSDAAKDVGDAAKK